MLKLNLRVSFFLFLVLKCSFIHGQGICPPNEVPSECSDPCNSCDSDMVCPAVCLPGCQCLPGYTRDSDGICIPRQLCTGRGELSSDPFMREPDIDDTLGGRTLLSNRGGCPNPRLCTLSCRTRGFRSGACLGPGREYCNCYSNLSGGGRKLPIVPDITKNVGLPLGGVAPVLGGVAPVLGGALGGVAPAVGGVAPALSGISPRYLNPPPPVAPYPPALPPKLPLVPKPLYPPALPLPNPYVPGLPRPPKLPVVPGLPLIPKPPPVKPLIPPALPGGGCRLSDCVVSCQSKGSSSGFCSGLRKGTCVCL